MTETLLKAEDLKIEVIYLATGTTTPPRVKAGTPPSDVRITHIPSGISAQCGIGRSQHRDRQICMEMIEAALTCRWYR